MGVYKYGDVINIKAADEIHQIRGTLSRYYICLQGSRNSAFVNIGLT